MMKILNIFKNSSHIFLITDIIFLRKRRCHYLLRHTQRRYHYTISKNIYFHYKVRKNRATYNMSDKITISSISEMLDELQETRNATSQYLSSTGIKLS